MRRRRPRLFEQNRNDLVVTDLFMPGLRGSEVVRRIRRLDPAVPIVMLARSATPEDARLAREHGALVLAKPVPIEDFRQAVERLCWSC